VSYDLKDYVTVAQRLRVFLERYPDGSMQLDPVEFREIEGKTWVIGRAYAYRTPDDPRPGIGTAWEVIPGMTPFTKYSEVQNVETSAWGRALAAIGIGIDKGVATWEEVNRTSRQERPKVVPPGVDGPLAKNIASEPPSDRQRNYAKSLMGKAADAAPEIITRVLGSYSPPETWSKYETSQVIEALKAEVENQPKVERTSTPGPDDWHTQEPPEDTG